MEAATPYAPAVKVDLPVAAGRPPFPKAEVDALPDRVSQPVATWEELQAHGAKGLEEFKGILDKVADELGLRTDLSKPKELTAAHLDVPEGFLFLGQLKGEKRAKEKVAADYEGDWSQLKDMVRATVDAMLNPIEQLRALPAMPMQDQQAHNDWIQGEVVRDTTGQPVFESVPGRMSMRDDRVAVRDDGNLIDQLKNASPEQQARIRQLLNGSP